MFDQLKDSIKDFSDKAKSAVAEKELEEEELDELLWDLELSLLKNNVAEEVVDRLKKDLKEELAGEKVSRRKAGEEVKKALEKSVKDILKQGKRDIRELCEEEEPKTVLFMGFNGSGKTTTIAKVASMLKEDYKVLLAAGDTFRSAAIDQLEEHAKNLDLKLIKHEYGADSAAVIYDAKEHAEKKGYDMVLADTAGRSHEDRNLMDELEKICRVNDPEYKILVVDALSGNDVVEQAEKYEEMGFDSIILTKADVDKKGGAALSLGYVTGKPILYLGTGQDYEDLDRFEPEKIAEQLLKD
ncbi:MAG: signal recognition particle-docking protein FtsY [Candidatus Nanohaloarchaeota archaeon QJJ-9]|nr:signal recognition particle-docking protein FtsY [Candidatus Nanohaloarchaeota archaeon QJJ-9]